MQLVMWLVVCAVLALIFRRRFTVLVGIALGLRVAIPSVAADFVTGQGSGVQFQPASYFLAAALVFSLLTRPKAYAKAIGDHFIFWMSLAVVFSAALIVTVSLRSPSSVVLLVDTLGFGLLLCLLIRAGLADSPDTGANIARTVVGLASAQAVIAIAQWSIGGSIFWQSYMLNYYWYSPTATRATGTMGAWLDLATLLAVAVPLCAAIKRPLIRFSAAVLLIIGIVLSQSRFPLIIGVLGVVYLLFVSRMTLGKRVLSSVGVTIAAWAIVSGALFREIAERFDSDTISATVRSDAFDYFWASIDAQPWHGNGFGANGLTRAAGLASSFENGYLMYAWDIGMFFTLIFVVALVSQVLLAMVRGQIVAGTVVALTSALILIGSYSGLQTPGPGSWILFAAVGLCASRAAQPSEERSATAARYTASARVG